uniref:Uncharacterized protein n=1 Tax=Ciona intestinalis TaxID=7719 RepID=H2XLJ1_CIOIN
MFQKLFEWNFTIRIYECMRNYIVVIRTNILCSKVTMKQKTFNWKSPSSFPLLV